MSACRNVRQPSLFFLRPPLSELLRDMDRPLIVRLGFRAPPPRCCLFSREARLAPLYARLVHVRCVLQDWKSAPSRN